jgi:hypothetical protein
MEIGPVPGIRGVGGVQTARVDLRTPVLEIDRAVRPGDGRGLGNGRKAAGAEEDSDDDSIFEGEPEPSAEEDATQRNVDYFA